MEKMTYAKALEVAINAITENEVKEKLIALKAQIEKRNAGDRKPTKTQIANEALKADIVSYIARDDGKYTVTDLILNVPTLEGVSNQKVAALVTQLCETEVLKREEIKHRAYFSIR